MRKGYLDIIKLLIKVGANIHAMNKDSETPYILAQNEFTLWHHLC
jgi:ankyrin repeat protein